MTAASLRSRTEFTQGIMLSYCNVVFLSSHCLFIARSLKQVCGQLSRAGIVFALHGTIGTDFARNVTGSICELRALTFMKEQDLF